MLKLCKVTKVKVLFPVLVSFFSFSSILTHPNLLPPFWRRVYCWLQVHFGSSRKGWRTAPNINHTCTPVILTLLPVCRAWKVHAQVSENSSYYNYIFIKCLYTRKICHNLQTGSLPQTVSLNRVWV